MNGWIDERMKDEWIDKCTPESNCRPTAAAKETGPGIGLDNGGSIFFSFTVGLVVLFGL